MDRDPTPSIDLRWHHSLRTRMALWSGLLNAVLVLATTLAFYLGARMLVVHNARVEAQALTRQGALNLEAILDSVQVSGRTLAAGATGVGAQPLHLRSLLLASLAGDPDIAGAMIIVEPGRLAPDDPGFTWYIRRDGERLVERSVQDLGYDYRAMPWYVRTLQSTGAWWSEPYANAATAGADFTTYNLPLRLHGDGALAPALGMVSLDVPVARLLDGLLQSTPDEAGLQPMLFSPGGLAVLHPDPELRMRQRLEVLVENGRADLVPLAQAQARGETVEFEHEDPASGESFLTQAAPVGDSGWTFATSASESFILRQLREVAQWVALIGLLALLPALVLVRRYTGRLLQPIEDLTESARHFASGEFDYPLPHIGRRDEVGVMARAFNTARGSIKRQLREIEAMAGARQKLESELGIAREIQQSMLPHARMIEHGGMRMDLCAVLEPAKAVGGDFYQFSELDGGALWFSIGDVSDKGVPAALFMARTATVLEGQARRLGSPGAILAAASGRLVEGNETCMFATVLCGRLEIDSGRCLLASAGHDAPVLVHADGRIETLALEAGPPLGFEVFDGFVVRESWLPEGATLVAWTDGITEAFDADDTGYGDERLHRALVPGEAADQTCRRLLQDVQHFVAGAAQSDDITVLAIRRTRSVPDAVTADAITAEAAALATGG
ncbi:SpoIIE family protein phosphatase [Luteimonas kalidii]|uniref:SpoIIE family protein phosphatase n=1 Tax=Luteimonas kalidii TaxID=3042025 RepID=A0ABT6JWL6_9GAMM|nr:SpoIIE family protein phosphatase [Luteimonas kalidii]MDH5835085.1 SpoIIE family protein phosphatase [Luteimonas kalidii]